MTQVFTDDGRVFPATLISAGPLVITQVKTDEKDGYRAVQVGFGERKLSRISKAVAGHTRALIPREDMGFAVLKEKRLTNAKDNEMKLGDSFDVSVFEEGDVVMVSGISKGKGFQGVVKRHNFKGGPRTHGQKHSEREPGSIGATGPQRVFKGTRMGGRMGSDRVSVKNLKVLKIDKASNSILVSGAVPGRRGTLLEISGK